MGNWDQNAVQQLEIQEKRVRLMSGLVKYTAKNKILSMLYLFEIEQWFRIYSSLWVESTVIYFSCDEYWVHDQRIWVENRKWILAENKFAKIAHHQSQIKNSPEICVLVLWSYMQNCYLVYLKKNGKCEILFFFIKNHVFSPPFA